MATGWFKGKINKITMEEYDRPDLYAEFVDINSLPYGETKVLQEKYAGLDTDNPDAKLVKGLFEVLITLLKGWNMTNPETDEPLLRPEKAEDFDELPMEVLVKIIEGAMGTPDEKEVPKESETKP